MAAKKRKARKAYPKDIEHGRWGKYGAEVEAMRSKGLLQMREVAERCGVAITTVSRWLDGGKVRGELVGGWRRYITVESLVEHLGPTIAKERGLVKE